MKHALEIFPREIWEKIFLKLSNKERFKFRFVCQTFHEAIERIIARNKLWGTLFQKDAIYWKSQIIDKRFPTVRLKQWRLFFQSVFKQMFLSYQKWKLFGNSNRELGQNSCNFTKNFGENKVITCFDVWGAKGLIAVTTSAREQLKFWNVSRKREIVTSEVYYGRNLCVGLNRRLFVEYEYTITEYKFDLNQIHQGANCRVETFNDPDAKFLALYSEQDKLQVLMRFGTVAAITIFRIQKNIPVFTQIDEDFFPLRPSITRVRDNIIHDDDLICEFHISSMNVTIFAHAGFLTARVIESEEAIAVWKVCSVPLAKNEIVTCVFMFADLLLIGLNTGHINVYAIQNIKSLLDAALIFKNLRAIKVDTSPIIAINSTEINKKSYIVASTKSKLFAINISV
ncbi:hypothetical protein KQX54_019057 [Cotesia glomerata]|uniref:F-box domain-containing protein n=1 Tax=Cotesia glomerata TaxID=32391 RepID=A0AAV7HG70_COTGL|nr:hypothetical protein KQX54_019057 [Cotesia glomerata]